MSAKPFEFEVERGEPNGAWLYVDEIAHRAINDIAIMLSIVRRTSRTVSDPTAAQALGDISMRLTASAMGYRLLRPPHDFGNRNLDDELATLCAALSASILAERAVELKLVCEPITVSADVSWRIGMIVAELVTNAARHAFQDSSRGSVIVDVSTSLGTIRCAVIDNGSSAAVITAGRGSAITEAIAVELGGTITRDYTGAGSAIVLQVPRIVVDRY